MTPYKDLGPPARILSMATMQTEGGMIQSSWDQEGRESCGRGDASNPSFAMIDYRD